MATIKFKAVSTEANLLTTELDSLANNTLCTVGAEYSAANNELFCNLKLIVAAQGSARSAGASIYVWLVPESNGDYSDVTEQCLGAPNHIFSLDASTTARTLVVSNILLPNSTFKPILKNSTGQALASSGNSLEIEYYSQESV